MHFYAEHPRPGVRGLPPSLKVDKSDEKFVFLSDAGCLS
jgi:hypothetical protein